MNRRRTTFVAGAGVLLSASGAVLIWLGTSEGPTWLTLAGIVTAIAGLVSLRVVFWARRVRAMTRAGMALSDPEKPTKHPGGGSPADPSG